MMTTKDKLPSALQTVAHTARCGSRGVIALFSGDTGTGKAMAAISVASALAVPILRVQLHSFISKYIGETEKNLERVFEAAEAAGAMLFFDEADALFGKRGEVEDVNDRYANVETEYLLQRLERFRGVIILAATQTDDLERTFLKKIPYVLRFPLPETD